jgi:hypothetical protein
LQKSFFLTYFSFTNIKIKIFKILKKFFFIKKSKKKKSLKIKNNFYLKSNLMNIFYYFKNNVFLFLFKNNNFFYHKKLKFFFTQINLSSLQLIFLKLYKKIFQEGFAFIKGLFIILFIDACLTDDEPL